MDEQSRHAAPSNAYAANLLPLLALYAAAPWVGDRNLAAAWALLVPIGLLLYRLTMVMHDCGHASLFTSRRANLVWGSCWEWSQASSSRASLTGIGNTIVTTAPPATRRVSTTWPGPACARRLEPGIS